MTTSPLPILWTDASAVAATGGRATRPWAATGLSIDSRKITPGDLFIAIQGPNFDGHAFTAAALAAGAAAALVSRVPDDVPAGTPLLIVDGDTLDAMAALGQVSRAACGARMVGVTGSVGKTSTKETLRHVLAAQGATYATEGSLNNHWGVPLSLARLPADSRFGVFELGMNHAGELGPLSRQVRPHVALITNVEAVHLEFFDSVAAIADAKAEIFDGLAPDGVAILNRDNAQFDRLAAAARARGLSRIHSFGTTDGTDAQLLDLTLGATSSAATARVHGQTLSFTVAMPGRHWVMNSLGVLLAVAALGGDAAQAAQSLATLNPVKGRGVRKTVTLADGGTFTLVDESYNASPAAMAATLGVLGNLPVAEGGRRIAVLGDMRELGDTADALHADLAEPLLAAGVERVYACGPHMRVLFDRLPPDRRGAWTETSRDLAPIVADAVRANDVVMVKGSLGSRTGLIVDALLTLDTAQNAAKTPATTNTANPPDTANGPRG